VWDYGKIRPSHRSCGAKAAVVPRRSAQPDDFRLGCSPRARCRFDSGPTLVAEGAKNWRVAGSRFVKPRGMRNRSERCLRAIAARGGEALQIHERVLVVARPESPRPELIPEVTLEIGRH